MSTQTTTAVVYAGCLLVGSVLVSVSPWLLAVVAPVVWWMLARLVTRDQGSADERNR